MKECYVCNGLDRIHFRLNLRTIRLGYFVTMNVENLFFSKINTVMGERESLNFIKERGK